MDVSALRQSDVEARLEVGVALLHTGVARPAVGPGGRAGPLGAPGGVVGAAEHPHLAVADQAVEGSECFLQGDGPVLDVRPVHVDAVRAQASQAVLRGLAYHRRRQSLGRLQAGAGDGGPGAHLGGDHHVVVPAAVGQPAADGPLALVAGPAGGPEGVVVGGVDEIASGLDEPVEDGERRLLVHGGAEGQGAQAQGADEGAGEAPDSASEHRCHLGLPRTSRRAGSVRNGSTVGTDRPGVPVRSGTGKPDRFRRADRRRRYRAGPAGPRCRRHRAATPWSPLAEAAVTAPAAHRGSAGPAWPARPRRAAARSRAARCRSGRGRSAGSR